jgi:serine/threonine-protein kinase
MKSAMARGTADETSAEHAPASEAGGKPVSMRAKAQAEALIGHVVAERYRIDRIIAMGGMGAVYAGEHVHLHKEVAIKLLHPETKNLPELVSRFERESIVGAHASDRHVASATDFGKDSDGSYYLVCELVDGINLRSLMNRGPIPIERAVDIARQIAEGLHAVHELDIVHRDLNPRNVMVSEAPPDHVKLIDFGFAKVPVERFGKGGPQSKAEAMSLTAEGMVFGTVGFMAPESAFGMPAVDKPADLYALGVILYEMLTGEHPYDETDQKKLFRCHALDPIPSFAERAPDRDVPETLEAICMRLLEKDPAERYASATAVLDAFDEAMRAPAPRAPSPPPSPEDDDEITPWSERPEASRGRGPLLIGLLLFLAAGVVLMVPGVRDRIFGPGLFGSGNLGATTATSAPTHSVSAPPSDEPMASAQTSTSAEASASASGAPPPAPRPTQVDGLDADAWTIKLRQAVASRSGAAAFAAIQALATLDPERLGSHDLVDDVALATVTITIGPDGDALFELLDSEEIGTAGPDVLYRLVTFHGGSKAARRAEEALGRDEVLARASKAMRIARELRQTPCRERAELLERAADEGDRRALLLMSNMTPRDCSTCCLHAPGLGPAIRKLSDRLKKK